MTRNTIEHITYRGLTLCIIIPNDFRMDGISFFTPDDFSQQLGYMKREKEFQIKPHRHNIVNRNIKVTQEVLFIKSGKVRVDFYSDYEDYIDSRILVAGDIILLANGGHGFKMLEDSEIIEVKQGPYCGEEDKVRFEPVDAYNINVS